MRIKAEALTAIHIPHIRNKLATALNCTDQTIMRHIKENFSNGLLTTAKALQIIREETGLTDIEILEEECALQSQI